MRRTVFVPLVLATFVIPGSARAQTKIGYVNSQEIMAAAPGAKQAQAEFDKDMQGYQDSITKLQNELQTMQNQLQQQELTLSPEAKKNRQAEIQAKQQEYQQRYQDLQNEASQRRQQLMQPIVSKVDSIIEQIRRQGHYAMILDVTSGSILAADTTLDLTQEVIQRLKVGSGTDAKPTADAKGTGGKGGTR